MEGKDDGENKTEEFQKGMHFGFLELACAVSVVSRGRIGVVGMIGGKCGAL